MHVRVSCGRLGDCLSTLPFLRMLVDEHGGVRVSGSFNESVKNLIPHWPLVFDETPDAPDYEADVNFIFNYCHARQLHMAQGYFALYDFPVPEVPISHLRLLTEPCGLEPGIVISPFSMTDNRHNKAWFEDRWNAVIGALRTYGYPIYVLGADKDDATLYDAIPVFDRPLTEVLELLRASPLVVTIDNGISHLCHFGGVSKHVLLYPSCLARSFVPNPRARVIQEWPERISVDSVISACRAKFTT